MKIKFKTIAIAANSKNKKIVDIARQCCEVLSNQSLNILLSGKLVSLDKFKGSKVSTDLQISKKADLLIAIGGDGTMLSCSRRFGFLGLPLLGINLGNLGFLTDIAPEDITSSLMEVVNGNYLSDKRFFLQASLNKSKETNLALNEIVIHSGALAQLMEYEVSINDNFVYLQKADGLIINSPTGSTAYALSGGGPIIHPSVKAINLMPMFPHSLSTSPLLVDDASVIKIKMVNGKGNFKLSFDSHHSLTLKKGDYITVKKTESVLTLIHPQDNDFFSSCRNKLGWSSGFIKSH